MCFIFITELRQRIIDKETFFPARFQENTKRATAAVLNAAGPNVKDQYVGIAFFVSPTRLVTTQHILASNYAGFVEGCVIRIGVHAAEGGVCIQDAFLVRSAIEWDLAVLTIESPHHSHLHLPTSIASSNGQKLAIISFTSHLSDLAPNAVDNSFCLIPGNLVKINGHHVVYSTELFNGDSGGAVILSSDGTAVALHQKSVNQAIELARVGGVDDDDDYDDLSGIKIDDEKYYEHVSKKMRGISKTLNSLVTGLSQGFIGLRLDCKDIQDFIFQ